MIFVVGAFSVSTSMELAKTTSLDDQVSDTDGPVLVPPDMLRMWANASEPMLRANRSSRLDSYMAMYNIETKLLREEPHPEIIREFYKNLDEPADSVESADEEYGSEAYWKLNGPKPTFEIPKLSCWHCGCPSHLPLTSLESQFDLSKVLPRKLQDREVDHTNFEPPLPTSKPSAKKIEDFVEKPRAGCQARPLRRKKPR